MNIAPKFTSSTISSGRLSTPPPCSLKPSTSTICGNSRYDGSVGHDGSDGIGRLRTYTHYIQLGTYNQYIQLHGGRKSVRIGVKGDRGE